MAQSSIISHLQDVTPQKERVTDKLKGMLNNVSRKNPFEGGRAMLKQVVGSAPHMGTVRKSTPRSGKKLR